MAERLDALGEALDILLVSEGETEVATTGGRRIDIVVEDVDGSEFVIENQYGKADHDHLTRGLAYAVARGARGLVIVAEQHLDEFRAVADYLNPVASTIPTMGSRSGSSRSSRSASTRAHGHRCSFPSSSQTPSPLPQHRPNGPRLATGASASSPTRSPTHS